jgi:hypothetical protein
MKVVLVARNHSLVARFDLSLACATSLRQWRGADLFWLRFDTRFIEAVERAGAAACSPTCRLRVVDVDDKCAFAIARDPSTGVESIHVAHLDRLFAH